ncbi:hypothetical protein [Gluconacetobacter sacchari]|uniref:Uncharacterized protein n=1 Tax=Gluconacetobacter sacchari TaxID=92759 RepID=A0A7W4IAR7_9PROT|nr:hypothetical protein [Gluconacetobacter sacchari]MBB2159337.1 hypothetical protein [Gluconacetobacter sacchari]
MVEGNHIDEAIWRPILEVLNKNPFGPHRYLKDIAPDIDSNIALQNIYYLAQNKLCTANIEPTPQGSFRYFGGVQITTRGIDFLKNDGGLSKRLRTITVELDGDTIKALIADKVDQSDAPDEDKGKLKHAIRSLPSNALTALTGELVKRGLSSASDLLPWLETALRHL